jgi:hypothetical protein
MQWNWIRLVPLRFVGVACDGNACVPISIILSQGLVSIRIVGGFQCPQVLLLSFLHACTLVHAISVKQLLHIYLGSHYGIDMNVGY